VVLLRKSIPQRATYKLPAELGVMRNEYRITMEELRKLLMRMADTANAAQAHYQIWLTLRGEDKALPEFYKDMNDHRYVDFFHANNSGNYKLIYIELGCLFDSDTRTASFRNLKCLLEENGFSEIVNRINISLAPYGELISNAKTIRSKLIAHKELLASSETIHQENAVIPNEIGKLLNICCALINEIDAELFGNNGCLIATVTNRFEKATFAMLEVLKNGRS